MKFLAAILLIVSPCLAQVTNPSLSVQSDPGGACTIGSVPQVNVTTGQNWACVPSASGNLTTGAWAKVSPADAIVTTTSDPTGSACTPKAISLRTPAGTIYTCQNGTYAAAIGGGAPTGTAGGDLSGTYPNPNVAKINGVSLAGLATGPLCNTATTGAPIICGASGITPTQASLPDISDVSTTSVTSVVELFVTLAGTGQALALSNTNTGSNNIGTIFGGGGSNTFLYLGVQKSAARALSVGFNDGNGVTANSFGYLSIYGDNPDIILHAGGHVTLSGNNGTTADCGATLCLAGQASIGTKFTISGCTAGTTVGGATSGHFSSGTTGTCTVVITMNGATGLTVPNGWHCSASDLTTPANLISQAAPVSATQCTLTGTTVSGDVISFAAYGN